MPCLNTHTLTGILADCEPNLAGIAEVWMGYYGDFNVAVDLSAQTVTGFTKTTTGNDLQHYAFAKQTGSLTSTLTKDEANGTRYYTNALALQFSKLERIKHLEFQALAAEQLVAIVKDNNGKYWFLGYDGYLSSADGTAQTGQSYDDLNGYNITLNAMSAYLPFEISESLFKSNVSGE